MNTDSMITNQPTSIWVLGNLITLLDTTGDYDMTLIETPAYTPGPPPHYHTFRSEVFYIMEGSAEFFIEGKRRVLTAGEYVDLPINTLHTFNNVSDQPIKMLNIHSPKGFRKIFEELGVPQASENARDNSMKKEIIDKTMQIAPEHDMHIVLPEAPE